MAWILVSFHTLSPISSRLWEMSAEVNTYVSRSMCHVHLTLCLTCPPGYFRLILSKENSYFFPIASRPMIYAWGFAVGFHGLNFPGPHFLFKSRQHAYHRGLLAFRLHRYFCVFFETSAWLLLFPGCLWVLQSSYLFVWLLWNLDRGILSILHILRKCYSHSALSERNFKLIISHIFPLSNSSKFLLNILVSLT